MGEKMKRFPCVGLLLFSLTLRLHTIAAETTDTDIDSSDVKYFFNPIVITATKVAGAQRDLVASVSLIDETKLRHTSTNTVLEAVKTYVPGVYVTEWGVMGYGATGDAAGKISIRGLGGGADTHVLILRNGRPDFMGLMGCTIADEFATNGVERIEVLRGPASFLYGTNATGGVINIVPKKMSENGFKTTIGGGYGSFNTQKFSATHSGKRGDFEYVLTAATRKTDGHRDDANSKYKADHFTAHLGYTLGRNTTLELNGGLANIDVNDPGPETDPSTDHWFNMTRYGGDLTLTHNSRFGETNLKFHSNFGHHKFSKFSENGWRSHDRMLGIMAYQNINPFKGNTTTIGFDYKRYGGDAVDDATDFGEFFITEYAPYIHTQQLFLGRFIASAGLRIEHHELYGNETVPKAGLVAHATSSTTVRFSAAKGFRSPSIRELYFFPPQNAELQPERLWNYEVGLIQHVGQRLKLEGTLFRSEGSNLVRRSNPGFPFQWVNSGKFVHTGYELMLDWLPTEALELGASWSKLDLCNETLYAPGRKLTAHATVRLKPVTLSGDFIYIMDLYGADNRENPMEDYALFNLTLQTSVFKFIRVKAAVKNVLDTEYQAMVGYPMPGRHLMCDVSYYF